LGGGLSFRKNGERAALAGARLAKYHGPANLGVIAVHLWRELGSDDVAFLKAALGRRVHPEDFRSSGGDQHKVVFGSTGPEEGLDFGDEFVFRHTGFRRVDKMP